MAGISNWMHVDLFTVEQAAALWAGFDPASLSYSERMHPSEVVAVKQLLITCIANGELRADTTSNVFARIGKHDRSLVARHELEAAARKRNLYPAFLFDTLAPVETPQDILAPDNRPVRALGRQSGPKPQHPVIESVGRTETQVVSRAGRPQEYDWDSFTMEIIRRADTPDGLPDTQAELVGDLLAWFNATCGREPSESAVKARVSKIYRYLGKAKNPVE